MSFVFSFFNRNSDTVYVIYLVGNNNCLMRAMRIARAELAGYCSTESIISLWTGYRRLGDCTDASLTYSYGCRCCRLTASFSSVYFQCDASSRVRAVSVQQQQQDSKLIWKHHKPQQHPKSIHLLLMLYIQRLVHDDPKVNTNESIKNVTHISI